MEPLPSNVTVPPAATTVADGTIRTVGAEGRLTVTVVVAVDERPALSTTRSATVKEPAPVVITVAAAVFVALLKTAIALPLVMLHWYEVMLAPPGAVALLLKPTLVPTVTVLEDALTLTAGTPPGAAAATAAPASSRPAPHVDCVQ